MNEKKDLNILIGSNIQREREKRGYTQESFSEIIGIGPKSLSAVERGAVGVSLKTLLRICEVLNLSPGALLYENSAANNASSIADQLSRLTPEQFSIASEILDTLFKSFKMH